MAPWSQQKIWIDRVCKGSDQIPCVGLKIKMRIDDWMVIGDLAWCLVIVPSVLAFLTSFYTPTKGLSCRSMTFLAYMLCQFWLIALWAWDIESTYLDEEGAPHTPVTRLSWNRESLQAYVWWPLVIIGGVCAVVTAIGGTTMQFMGVYRNCLCYVPIQYWHPWRPNTTFIVSTNFAEGIERARTWWKITGAAAIAFLGLMAFVGWWYQRRLRYQFKLLVDRLDENAEEEPLSN